MASQPASNNSGNTAAQAASASRPPRKGGRGRSRGRGAFRGSSRPTRPTTSFPDGGQPARRMPLTDFSGRVLLNPLTQSYTLFGGLKKSLTVFDKVVVELVPFAGDWKSCVHFEKDGHILTDTEASVLLSHAPVKETRGDDGAVLLEKANRHLEELRHHLPAFQQVLGIPEDFELPAGPLSSIAELESLNPKLVPALKMNRSQFRVVVEKAKKALPPGSSWTDKDRTGFAAPFVTPGAAGAASTHSSSATDSQGLKSDEVYK